MKNDKLWQPLIILAFVVIIFSFFSRMLSRSDTLYDYAQQNPEIAYAPKTEVETETMTEAASETLNTEEALTLNSNDEHSSISTTTNDSTNNIEETEISTVEETLCVYPAVEDIDLSNAEPHPDRVTYAEGFFYEPITPEIEARIRGISYPEDDSNIEISLDDLSYVGVLYNDFDGNIQNGELICNDSIALDLVEIFEELYRNNYQFEEISLIDKYDGDDTLSMENNNTSCFNYRIVDGTDHLSKHAYGLAIDINPFYNPYVVLNKDGSGETYISPKGSEAYTDRSKAFPYKIDENDLCYKLFIEHGFTWGGNWNSSKDYQHFQKAN